MIEQEIVSFLTVVFVSVSVACAVSTLYALGLGVATAIELLGFCLLRFGA